LRALTGHYMPPSLLQSQLDTLELPGADEHAIVLDIACPPEQQLALAERELRSAH
jgi:gluconokinase